MENGGSNSISEKGWSSKGLYFYKEKPRKSFHINISHEDNRMDIFLPHTRKIIFNKTHSETSKLFEFEFKLLKTLNSFI